MRHSESTVTFLAKLSDINSSRMIEDLNHGYFSKSTFVCTLEFQKLQEIVTKCNKQFVNLTEPRYSINLTQ